VSSLVQPRLVAISKLQLPSSIMAAHVEGKQLHFGENYVQELVEKAQALPKDIRWHFVGALQSNKGKALAGIPNLYLLETLDSIKAANVLEKALAAREEKRPEPLRVYIQINTSGEEAKSGITPLLDEGSASKDHPLLELTRHILTSCPHIRFSGLMTIGAAQNSQTADAEKVQSREDIIKANPDFEKLITSRRMLVQALRKDEQVNKAVSDSSSTDASITSYYQEKLLSGDDETGGLELSMGMSADMEIATMAGSDNVRVGSECFGSRTTRDEAMKAMEEELKGSA
jgi:PLP dependent protein